MPSVNVQDGGHSGDRDRGFNFDVAIRRFRRACEKAGIPTKLRQMEYYEKPTSKRKRKRAAARKRFLKKLQKQQETLERERTRW